MNCGIYRIIMEKELIAEYKDNGEGVGAVMMKDGGMNDGEKEY